MGAGASGVDEGQGELPTLTQKGPEFSTCKTAHLSFCHLCISVEIRGKVLKLGHWCGSACGA